MIQGNPYIVRPTKLRRRFRPEVVGGKPVEVVNKETGEITVGTQLVGRQKIYDSTEFIKLYDPSIFLRLSQPAVAVFAYIIANLQFGGIVYFSYKDALLYTGYKSRESIFRGLQDLLKNDVIRNKEKQIFWVNPNIVYRGQRDEFETIGN